MKRLFRNVWHFLKSLKTRWFFARANKKLKKKITDREVDRIILKDKIVKEVKKYINPDGKSKYIPFDRKSRARIREKVYADFGSDMAKVNIRLNENLKICDC